VGGPQAGDRPRIAVVGGGICGLALAHRLLDHADVTVFEAAPCAGGHARTVHEDGFVIETGPNGFLDRNPGPLALAHELGLDGALVEARPAATRRFIVRGGRLRRVPDSPLTLLTSDALSPAGKLRILGEPWVPRLAEEREETVHEFARRRIGAEAADALVDAAVSGISAGDSRTLSLPAAFPAMAQMEHEHGGLFAAMLARRRAGKRAPRLLSFREGMGQFVGALTTALGPRLRTGSAVARLERAGSAWNVVVSDGSAQAADRVVFATPARVTARVLSDLDPELAHQLQATPFSSVAVVALAYRASDLPRLLDGYGYLVPRREDLATLGVVWESSLFPARAPEGFVLVRAILGGARRPAIAALSESERMTLAHREFARVLRLRAEPVKAWTYAWPVAIAQYTRGHRERVAAVRAGVAVYPGLSLCGTSYDGVSFGAAIDVGRAHADDLMASLPAGAA
jgi:oxygen-dependent protoporphyrinogen oxidase